MLISSIVVVEAPVSNNSAVFIARTQLLTRKQESWPWNYPTTPRTPKGKKLDPHLFCCATQSLSESIASCAERLFVHIACRNSRYLYVNGDLQ